VSGDDTGVSGDDTGVPGDDTGTVPGEHPLAPELLEPEDGAIVAEVRPWLVIRATTDPDDDPGDLLYTFAIADSHGEELTHSHFEDVEWGVDTVRWQVTLDLSDGAHCWAAWATDPQGHHSPANEACITIQVEGGGGV
jgi:hypothetical protein